MPLTDPVPSSSFDVLERNIQDTDKFVNQETGTFTNRVGKEIKPIPVIDAEANAAVISLGWHQVGLFADGFTYTLQNDIAKDAAGDWYRWNGSLPKIVTAGTIPSSDVNFVKIDYKSHAELSYRNPADGSAHNSDDIDFTNYVDQTAKFKQYVAGGGPIGANIRDTMLVSRTLSTLTDCHAFADKTVISNATDAGTYGAFDATTEIAGTHNQSHLFAFQDRTKFSGSGTLATWGNIIWPEHTGTGAVTYRANLQIKDINVTGGGTVGTNIGIEIQNLDAASSNSAITIAQDNGFSIYAPNAGAVQFGGTLRVDGTVTNKGTSIFEGVNYLGGNTKVGGLTNGTAPLGGTALTVEKNGLTTQGFVDVNSLGLSFGVAGDKKLQLVTNAVTRWTVADSAGGYAFLPSSTTPDIGSSAFRVGTLFAVNAINLSDAREKQQVRKITEAEKLAARELKENIIGYKWNQAVERKGDGARWHFGWIAQSVKEIMEKHGFDAFEYGFLCFDEWDDIYEDVQTNIGEKQLKTVENEYKREQQKFSIVPTKELVKVKKTIDGNEVIVLENQIVDKIVYEFNSYPVFNGDGTPALDDEGNPIIEREPIIETIIDKSVNTYEVDADPIYEKVLVKPAGNIYGINHNDIFAFVLSAC